MPQIFIDGKAIEAKDGATIIETAYDNGMEIPHFCWHPELSIAGNCRMCLVEVGMPRKLPDGDFEKDEDGNIKINFFPKLQIACATYVSEGMHVRVNSEKAIEAQEAVMEFLLINHPLDCPICDEAGECKLQEYAFRHSRGESRFEDIKNRKEKRVKWGPTVLFDAERCISCSRCIRFAKEYAEQDVLTFVQRGDHVTIELFEGTEFDNPYSMNVIDICPVRALTSRDFRFHSRVWEMSFNDSICPGCSRGCNIKIGLRKNEILRLEPRTNPKVNDYWMCDPGRLTQYPFVNENRIIEPMVKVNDKLEEVSWEEAYGDAAEKLRKFKPSEVMILGSGKGTNEANYLLKKFAHDVLKTNNLDYLQHIDESFADEKLRVKYRTANEMGVRELGIDPGEKGISADKLTESIKSGRIKALFVLEENFEDHAHFYEVLDNLELLVVCVYNHSKLTEKADVIFAASTYAETEGTYTNIDKRVQHFEPALVTTENRRQMGLKLSRLDKFGSHNDRWTHHEERNCRESWRTIMNVANLMGAGWSYKSAEEVFNDLAQKVTAFNNMNYEKLDEYHGLVIGKADNPEHLGNLYESQRMKPQVEIKPYTK